MCGHGHEHGTVQSLSLSCSILPRQSGRLLSLGLQRERLGGDFPVEVVDVAGTFAVRVPALIE